MCALIRTEPVLITEDNAVALALQQREDCKTPEEAALMQLLGGLLWRIAWLATTAAFLPMARLEPGRRTQCKAPCMILMR